MNLEDSLLFQFKDKIYASYCIEEKIVGSLPINDIYFVQNIYDEVKKLQPEVLLEKGFNVGQLVNSSGYTTLFNNNTATILIQKTDSMNNFCWMGTLVHELTHVKDYYDYISVLDYDNFVEMMKDFPFYCWTEFHAKYKGIVYMLKCARHLPQTEFRQYVRCDEDYIIRYINDIDFRNSYNTMHLIGLILAYEHSGISLSKTTCDNLFSNFNWLKGMKQFLEKHTELISRQEMLMLSSNLRKIFNDIQ